MRPPAAYTPLELLRIMCELRRNMAEAVDKLDAENFDHAAILLECAVSKLRIIQRAIDSSTTAKYPGSS